MIIHDVEQNTPEWLKLRLGIPTASCADKIVTPTGKLSSQSVKYRNQLIAEKLLNSQLDSVVETEYMSRGKALEPDAVKAYEFQNDCTVEKVGFITTDDLQIGCSPDRLVGDDGLLEIKCPADQTHIGYLIDGMPKDYIPQMQMQMFVTGRKWCDWMSYSPFMPPVIVKVIRDEEFIATLAEALAKFVADKNHHLARILEMCAKNVEEPLSAFEREYSGANDIFYGG